MQRKLQYALALALVAVPASWASAQSATQVPLYEGLGDHHHSVSTNSDQAQRYFDQGLVLAYAFNYSEAYPSFLKAAELDPECAMCWWGAAWVLGPNLNAAMDPERAPEAWSLLQRAESANRASERERAYIGALSQRYGPEPLDDRGPRDQAFATAMGEVAARYPDDLDARVMHVEALMDTMPWDYWREDGQPKPATETVLAELHEVLQVAPDHPMANHLMIHAVEAVHPEQGLEEAVRLADLTPGAGHLVHMPAHIYIRLGRYHEATLANQRAIAADQRYLAQAHAEGEYPLAYVPHNYHFLWATATLEGRGALAIGTARDMAALVDEDAMREPALSTLQHYWITPLYALVRFGRWEEILAWPEPAEDLVYPRAVRHYARGMALTRTGDFDGALRELEALNGLRDDPRLEWVTVWDINKSRHILEIAAQALTGELAAARGDYGRAIEGLELAVEREDALNYDEPPTWHYPTRQSLGAVLLEAGQPQRAEEIYREDLAKFPDNGWSLFGLLEALRRQGKEAATAEVQRRFEEAWQYADVVLTSSRM
jgi:tetratricopeptide (TPR) repeat protein